MLFDITVEPGERYNLIDELPEVAKAMRATLAEWDASCARSDAGADYPR